MSRALTVYAVDLDDLVAVIGSNDEETLNQYLAHLPETHDPRCCVKGITSCEWVDPNVFRAIFAGGPFQVEYAEDYVKALEVICRSLGPSVYDMEFHFRSAPDDIVELATEMNLDGPFPQAEWRGWGSWAKEGCAEELAELEADGDDEPTDYDDSDYAFHRLNLLYASKRTDKDLIGFFSG
ncbi:DUF7691 family protein [Nocardia sp. CA-151230]|uniref:DUF7691 family protein n=1 Tax=Nocardia sp. CA-151230 TaxID=3239982 RepID=UPI003D8CB426